MYVQLATPQQLLLPTLSLSLSHLAPLGAISHTHRGHYTDPLTPTMETLPGVCPAHPAKSEAKKREGASTACCACLCVKFVALIPTMCFSPEQKVLFTCVYSKLSIYPSEHPFAAAKCSLYGEVHYIGYTTLYGEFYCTMYECHYEGLSVGLIRPKRNEKEDSYCGLCH